MFLFIGIERAGGAVAVDLSIPISSFLGDKNLHLLLLLFWLFGSIRLDAFYFFHFDTFCTGRT